jgi:hypothetical protein
MPRSYSPNSPWMRALTSTDEDDGGGEGVVSSPSGSVETINPNSLDYRLRVGSLSQPRVPASQPRTEAPPVEAPMHRIEDDKTAGTRGVTPQGPSDASGFYAGATHPQAWGSATLPLEREITSEKAELARMNAPTKKLTLGGRLRGALGGAIEGAITGAGGPRAIEQANTLRDRVEARKQAERMDLANRISANTRSLSEEGMRAQASVAAAQRLGETLKSHQDIAQEQIQGRADVAGMHAETQEDIANKNIASREGIVDRSLAAKPVTRVMGTRTDQFSPSTDTWKDVGAAPANVTRTPTEPGNYQPVLNEAGQTVGWVDPKSGGWKPVGSIPGASQAASGASGAPLPAKLSGQTTSRMQQGQAIQRAGDNLIADIRARADKMGNWSNYWKQLVKGSPFADPDQNYLANQIMSFAALQPAAHGARGLQAIEAFEKAIGGTPTNVEAFIAGIQGIQRGLSSLQPPTGAAAPAQGQATHKIVNGRVVPIGAQP